MKKEKEKEKELLDIAANARIPASMLAKASDQKRVRREDFFSIYANSISVGISVWDVGLTFGEILGEEDGVPVIEEAIKILMSREMAKVMNLLLTANIAEYEKKYGVINIPDISKRGGRDEEKEEKSTINS